MAGLDEHQAQRQLLEEAVLVANLGSKTWCGQTYKNVFTGETLVNVLMKDAMKYPDRKTAVQDAQVLLDSRAIMSLTRRGAFDDDDRLYYINQDATRGGGKANKNLGSSKVGMEKKTAVSKEIKPEVNSGVSRHVKTKKQPSATSGSTSTCITAPSAELQRLLAKDTSQANVIRPVSTVSSSATSSDISRTAVKAGLSVGLKDKPLKDDGRFTEKINGASTTKMNADKAKQLSHKNDSLSNSSISTTKKANDVSVTILDTKASVSTARRDGGKGGVSSRNKAAGVSVTVLDMKEDVSTAKTTTGVSVALLDVKGKISTAKGDVCTAKTTTGVSVTVLEPEEDVKKVKSDDIIGNGTQSSLLERETMSKNAPKFGNIANDKQKLEKTLSPALSALIEKDAKNYQMARKPADRKVKEENHKVNEGSHKVNEGSHKVNEGSHKVNEGNHKVKENSKSPPVEVNGEADELSNSWEAFELKLQNKIKKISPRKSPRGEHEPVARGEHEEAAIIARARARHLASNVSDENNADKEVLSFSLESRKTSLAEKFQPGGTGDEIHLAVHDSCRAKGQEGVIVDGIVLTSLAARTSFLSAEENSKKSTVVERLPSVTLSDGKLGRPGSEVSVSGKDSGRVQSSAFSGDTMPAVVVEDDIPSEKSSPSGSVRVSSKEKRGSSFVTDAKTTVVIENEGSGSFIGGDKAEPHASRSSSFSRTQDHLEVTISDQSSTELKYPVHKKTSQTSSTGSQDDLVMVNGQLLPKSLAALLAKDVSGGKKTGPDNDPTNNVFKYKLKELKRNDSRTRSVSFSDVSQQGVKRDTLGQQGEQGDSSGVKHGERGNQDPLPRSGDVSRTNSAGVASAIERQAILGDNEGPDRTKVDENNNVSSSRDHTAGNEKGSREGDMGLLRTLSPVSSVTTKPVTVGASPLKEGGSQEDETGPIRTHSPAAAVSPSLSYTVPLLELLSPDGDSTTNAASAVATRPMTLPVSGATMSNRGTSSMSMSGSDSPTQMRLELDRYQREYEEKQRAYESKITELQLQLDYLRRHKSGQLKDHHDISLESSASMSDLTSLFSASVISPVNSTMTSPSLTPRGSMTDEMLTPRSPPPPPPAPPSLPPTTAGTLTRAGGNVKPTKPMINPKAEMKPLFWNRIIAPEGTERKTNSVWKSIQEPVIDTSEFERHFSKKSWDRKLKRTKSLRDDKHFTRINGKKVAKLLDADRSRAIGIKMSSLNCELKDIRNAVYNMDTSVVDMESLQFIYDIFPKESEIELIENHVEKHLSVQLDKPEEFMFQLTKMEHFKERLECWLYEEKFAEVIFGIDRSLSCVTESCSTIMSNAEITTILSLILAYGNYMNGSTVRGQADGFHLEVLPKLRDVKALDSDLNLLHYIVKQYIKQHERGSDKNKGSEYRLPSSVSLSNAAQVSFDTLKEELFRVSSLLKETEQQAKTIVEECSYDQRNPFEEKMRKFQATAKHKIAEANMKLDKAQNAFAEATEYFQWEPIGKKKSPQEFFFLWAKFVEDIKNCLKAEKQQQQVAKKNLSKVNHLNQIREAATKFRKRRQSVDDVI